jgi:hypothetical protein
MIKELEKLIDLAMRLDAKGDFKAASIVDKAIKKIAAGGPEDLFDDPEFEDEEDEEDFDPFGENRELRYEGDQEGALLGFPGAGLDEDDYDDGLGGDDLYEHMKTFLQAVIDGAYEDIEEVKREASNLLGAEAEIMIEDYPEEELSEPEGEMGQVLKFPRE